MVTSRDVAKHAGVSQATVSRVLSGSSAVRPETQRRVLAALEGLDYRPNSAARSMRTRRSGAVGVVVANLTNPFYPEVVAALSAELSRSSMRMMLWDSEGFGASSAVDAIQEGVLDGLVFTTATTSASPASTPLKLALERKAPVVLLTRGVPGLLCDQVGGCDFEGAQEIVDYLVSHGRTRLALVAGPRDASTAADREAGFWEAVGRHGIDPATIPSVRGDFSHDGGKQCLDKLIQNPSRPTAIFCVNDLTAFGVIDACRSAGIQVPHDVWVVGYNDIAIAGWKGYDLTTQRQPVAAMAATAVELLLERVARPTLPPRTRRFPPELIVRGSTNHAGWTKNQRAKGPS